MYVYMLTASIANFLLKMRERTNTERTYEVPISSFPRSGLNSVNKSVSYSEHLQVSVLNFAQCSIHSAYQLIYSNYTLKFF